MLETLYLTLSSQHPLVLLAILVLIIEFISRQVKKKMKDSIFGKYEWSTDPKHGEFYLNYYKKVQVIDIIRWGSILLFLSFILVWYTGAWVNLLVIAAGAFIITFKDFLLSIVAFFIIIRRHNIGDTIGIDSVQGQIIYIRMFSVWILGKDNDGDNTGRMFIIPTHKFLSEATRKEDLHSNSIRKELLKIPFKKQDFTLDFAEFMNKLEEYLESTLPTLSKKNCGNYQTYIGHKYKLDIDYLEEKCIIISIWLVWKWETNVESKKKITQFVESYRTQMTK